MKKILIIFILLFVLSGCVQARTEKEIEKINEKSNFLYPLLTVVTEEIRSKFNILEGFGAYKLIDPNVDPYQDDINLYLLNHPTTYYQVSAYPDFVNGGSYITMIETSDPEIHIYDLSVGDAYTTDEVVAYMETIGFYPHEDISSTYENANLRIRVYLLEGVIIKLRAEIEIMNRMGMIF